MLCFKKYMFAILVPPDERPKVRQYISGPIDTGTSVKLICSVTGGNPLGTLSWDCPGINSNNSTANTAVLEVEFTVDKNYNGRNCSCSATHPVATYRPKTSHELVVYCKFYVSCYEMNIYEYICQCQSQLPVLHSGQTLI